MAALVLGAVGAGIGNAIGGTFLGMSAAGIGWMVGSTLGNLIGQKGQNVQGARMGDLSVQASTYGAAIPIVHGAHRVAGNVIWSTPKREVATTTEVGGKGGPSVSQTTYSYNVDIAVALCAGTMAAVRRIWFNGKVIYDASESADAAAIVASQTRSTAFRFYPGDEAQLPDPAIEAQKGVGNAPAYRGTCYVVFEQLDCPNGQIPQMHFEVLSAAIESVNKQEFTAIPVDAGTLSASVMPGSITQFATGSAIVGLVRQGFLGSHRKLGYIDAARPLSFAAVAVSGLSRPHCVRRYVVGDAYHLEIIDAQTGAVRELGQVPLPMTIELACSQDGQSVCLVGRYDGQAMLADGGAGAAAIDAHGGGNGFCLSDGVVYNSYVEGSQLMLRTYSASTGQTQDTMAGPTNAVWASNPITLVYRSEEGLFVFVRASRTNPSGLAHVYRVDGSTWTLLCSDADPGLCSAVSSWYCKPTHCIIGPIYSGGATAAYTVVHFNAIQAQTVPLADIVLDYTQRAGLAPASVDVAPLSASVHGVALTRLTSAREALQPLLAAYFVDVTESSGKLRFEHRYDRTSVATIGWDDLGAGSQAAQPDDLALERQQDAELPRSMAINFLNIAADYQAATETARRQLAPSANDQSLDLTIATTADHAAAVAQGLLTTAWIERDRRSFSLPRKWSWLDPGDFVDVQTADGTTVSGRIVRLQDDGITIAGDLVCVQAAYLGATATGASPDAGQTGPAPLASSEAVLLDLPPLRQQDDDAGLYAAALPAGGTWSGALVYTGASSASLQSAGAVYSAVSIGYATSVLPVWVSGCMDQSSSVTVQMVRGELHSAARDAVLDNAANVALLGGELLQYMHAQDLGGGLYRLSGLLRGIRGTEHATATHTIGERFVLLAPASLARAALDPSAIGSVRQWRAVTIGQPIGQAPFVEQASTGQGVKPFAPVNLRRSGTGDIALTWDRRSRALQTFPANGVDVPLMEAAQAYECDIFADASFATVLRTIASSDPAVTYTLAQQTQDFGAPPATVSVRIYQIGRAGRGHPLQGTV